MVSTNCYTSEFQAREESNRLAERSHIEWINFTKASIQLPHLLAILQQEDPHIYPYQAQRLADPFNTEDMGANFILNEILLNEANANVSLAKCSC